MNIYIYMLVNYSTDFNTQHGVSFDRKRKDNAISAWYVLLKILTCVHFMNYSYQLTNIFNSSITQTFTVDTNYVFAIYVCMYVCSYVRGHTVAD